jgi:ribosomal protein L29
MVNVQELRKKSEEELKEELKKAQSEMGKVVKDVLQKKEKNVKKTGQLRKDIAKLKTLLSEKKILSEARGGEVK